MDQQLVQALDFIRDQITECGEAPSHDEIVNALHLSSTSQASHLVTQLVGEGRLVRTKARARNLAIPVEIDLMMASTKAMRAELARRGMSERPVPRRHTPTRPCAYGPCATAVPPGFLMCRVHWLSLPMTLRTKLSLLSVNGPEAEYAAAFARAVRIIEKGAGQ